MQEVFASSKNLPALDITAPAKAGQRPAVRPQ